MNQAGVQHVVSWVSPCVPGLSDSRTSVKANQEVDAYPWPRTLLKRDTLMDVRLPKIETPYVDDETGSLPVADFRECTLPHRPYGFD